MSKVVNQLLYHKFDGSVRKHMIIEHHQNGLNRMVEAYVDSYNALRACIRLNDENENPDVEYSVVEYKFR